MTKTAKKLRTQASLIEIARAQQNYVLKKRRDLHQIPELGWEEKETISYILKEIRCLLPLLPYDADLKEMEGGVVLDIHVHKDKERMLWRSDIDALPIQEMTHLPFQSKHPGLMHACGHDCHAAMLLGALRALASGAELTSNLRLVWQRAEEMLTTRSGGKSLVDEGVCDEISSAYGLHVSATHPAGIFFSRPDVMMANAAYIDLEISCRGGHVMNPEMGPNAVDIATEIQVAMRNFPSLVLPPEEKVNFVPTIAHAGSAYNIMPNHCRLSYSLRNFLEPRLLQVFLGKFKKKIEAIVSTYDDAEITKFDFHQGYPMLVNHQKCYNYSKIQLARGGFQTEIATPLYSGEDFAFYGNVCPTSFWLLGAKQGPGYGHHTAQFNPDESVFWQGVAFWLLLL